MNCDFLTLIAQVTPCWANVSTCDFTWRKDLVTGEVEDQRWIFVIKALTYLQETWGRACGKPLRQQSFNYHSLYHRGWATTFNLKRIDIKSKVLSQVGQRLSNLSGSFSGWQSVSGWPLPSKFTQMSLRLITEADMTFAIFFTPAIFLTARISPEENA